MKNSMKEFRDAKKKLLLGLGRIHTSSHVLVTTSIQVGEDNR